MILFRNGQISYMVAVVSKVPSFTYGKMLLGIKDADLDKMIPAAYTRPRAENGALHGEQYKAIEDDYNNLNKKLINYRTTLRTSSRWT